jgi:hypothetical protein
VLAERGDDVEGVLVRHSPTLEKEGRDRSADSTSIGAEVDLRCQAWFGLALTLTTLAYRDELWLRAVGALPNASRTAPAFVNFSESPSSACPRAAR